MALSGVLFSVIALSLVSGLYQERYQTSGHHDVTVCPDDYSPRDGCVTLDQLLSDKLIESNTTFKFVSATFKMKQVIRFENVSNITLESAGPQKANISCVGKNAGFFFYSVSGLALQNMKFNSCGAEMHNTMSCQRGSEYGSTTLGIKESSDILLKNLTFKYGRNYGVCGSNIYGRFTISNSVFTHMQGPSFALVTDTDSSQLNMITIADSQFDGYHFDDKKMYDVPYAIDIGVFQQLSARILLGDITITNNTHRGIGIQVESATPQTHILIERFNYSRNHVYDVENTNNWAISDLVFHESGQVGKMFIEIVESHFINNQYTETRAIKPFQSSIDSILYEVLYFSTPRASIFIRNTTILNSTGQYGPVIECISASKEDNVSFRIENSIIANNNVYVSDYYKKGTVHFKGVNYITVHNSSFVDNTATGLLVENSDIYFSGDNVIRGNEGYNGGGMALYGNSTLTLSTSAQILFENNSAENIGGGLYVKQNVIVDDNLDPLEKVCFLRIDFSMRYVSLIFINNSAKTAGNDWYGGDLHICEAYAVGVPDYIIGWKAVTDIVEDSTIELTSDPLHVCDCDTEINQDCINVVHTIQTVRTYPGKLFNLSLVAVGQLLNTTTLSGVPSAIYTDLLQLHPKSGAIPDSMRVQNGGRNCSDSELEYRIRSLNDKEVMVLTVDDNIDKLPDYYLTLWQQDLSLWHSVVARLLVHDLTVPAYVAVHLQHCPVGFELSETGECDCSTSLTGFVTNCSIDTALITKKPHIWISFINNSQEEYHMEDDNFSITYLTHEHCPFDYCNSSELKFSLEDPDTQCNNDRSGILCGQCKSGYSLTLGRMECRQCTNIYLLLLIPFGLAGIVLIIFLSLTDMTVAAGTINGLLFFANVVRENQATFFPSQATKGFLSVFIAWLNLDFGITTCFYDGLDSYASTWLQLSFPIFIWLLAFIIIIASRHFTFMNKLCGQNIVPVLATLFLLSYTKLQRTITTSLSFTVIDVINGTDYYVWLQDGNVHYFQGKHIPLFLVNVLFLVILFIPYTVSVMLGPWLQSKTQYKVFCWVVKLKPLFDAYFGPLKDRHRYWTGVLLVSRMILSLVSAVNIVVDDSINLLAINILCVILLILLWQSGGVYKHWGFSLLDSFFLVNLIILTLLTLYNKLYDLSNGRQYATICVSVGSVFAVFCLILLYHCIKKVMKDGVFGTCRRGPRPLLEGDNNDSSDDDLLDVIDQDDQKNL